MYLTTNGPNDHKIPANNTTGTAIFSFLSSIIIELLILIYFNYNKNEIIYKKILFDWFGKKQSTVSPFLNFSLPEGSITQIFDWINDLILNDSWPFKIWTSNLPLLEFEETKNIIGSTTNESIHSGIYNGVIAEVNNYIDLLKKEYPKLNVIIVGGFSKFLLNRIKNAIFADQDFLAQGLNYIINYNENR